MDFSYQATAPESLDGLTWTEISQLAQDESSIRFPEIVVDLSSLDQNIFVLMGQVSWLVRQIHGPDAAKELAVAVTSSAGYDDARWILAQTVKVR